MKRYGFPPNERTGVLPAGVGIAPGERAPDAVVHDAVGREQRLSDLFDRGPVLLVFYRGGWCPYCSFQIRELANRYSEYRKRDVLPVAAHADPDYKVRPSAAQILAAIDRVDLERSP